mmetsp:Transcript_58214/g.155025  ORF Transcript_58214/g.155025 Transcript_58214/m.155025 type:complete len:111 (+) Transcript_58214:1931-2263(+)
MSLIGSREQEVYARSAMSSILPVNRTVNDTCLGPRLIILVTASCDAFAAAKEFQTELENSMSASSISMPQTSLKSYHSGLINVMKDQPATPPYLYCGVTCPKSSCGPSSP